MKRGIFSMKAYHGSKVELFVNSFLSMIRRIVDLMQILFMYRLSLKVMVLVFGFHFLNASDLFAQFSGGNGTKEDPYIIRTWEQLALIKDKQSAAFRLVENLDRTSPGYDQFAGPNANSGMGWIPIANFMGVFDGNGNSISDLVINRPTESTIGLFKKAGNAQFRNLQLSRFKIRGASDIGGLLGVAIKVKISNCSFDGQVEGKYYVGGLVGTIGNSEITESFSLGGISGFRGVGGIAGNAYQTNLSRSFASGSVNANMDAGGLVGFFHSYSNNSIQDSYSVSSISANEVGGGLVGRISGATLRTSYAAGHVVAKSKAGGLFGWAESKVSVMDSFWDVEKTGQDANSGGGSGINTKSLKGKESLQSGAWNFTEIWEIKEPTALEPLISYPFLKAIKYDPVNLKEGKNPIPGLESAKIPSGINFPLVLVKTYGDPEYILGEEVDRLGQKVIYSAEDPSILKIEGNMAMILKAGTTKIKAEVTNTYNIADLIPLEQVLTIEPAPLKVSVIANQKKTFGSEDQKLGFTLSGFKYDDNLEILSGELVREPGENVGLYQINQGTLDAGGNYEIEFTPGHFEITKRVVVLEAQGKQKIFGSEDPELTFQVSGLDLQEVSKVLSGNIIRQAGEKVGKYVIGSGDLKASPNYEIDFKEGLFEIFPAELATIMDPKEIETPWAVLPNLPSHVSALTKDGQILELPVNWETSQLNLLAKGTCSLPGILELPEGILNPEMRKPIQKLTVLPKPAPDDILLSNNKFEPGSSKSVFEIGKFTVMDKVDDLHDITLVEGSLDNNLFRINGHSLSWKNEGKPKIKSQYSILVKVLDRGGNTIEKAFQLKAEFVRISDIEVTNTFTPDGDGINDTWGISALGVSEGARVQVFERSGSLIFSTENPEERWDGIYQGRALPEGTYYWILNFPKTGEMRKGFLNLLKK